MAAKLRSSTWRQPRVAVALLLSTLIFGTLISGTSAEETGLKLTEAELKKYRGDNPDDPIYLAIDGRIFDVSVSPAFYGPGGHYYHFTGKDASRAWVTECWDSEDQLTWRMDGIEDMFMPKYLDEQMQDAADGKAEGELAALGSEQMAQMAKTVVDKFNIKITEKEKAKRRKADKKEAQESVEKALQHWIDFFANNAKYKEVGTVVFDKSRPEPPKICEAAFKKRPTKGGKLQSIMDKGGVPGGILGGGAKQEPAGAGKMPDFVRDKLKKEAESAQPTQVDSDDEDLVKDEL